MGRLAHNTLYVTTPGAYLARDRATLVVRVEHEVKIRVPLQHLALVVVGTDVVISGGALEACIEADLGFIVTDWADRVVASLSKPGGQPAMLARSQHRLSDNHEASLKIAWSIVDGKLRNQRFILARYRRESSDEWLATKLDLAISEIDKRRSMARTAENAAALIGYEGDAAGVYFEALSAIVSQTDPKLRFLGRSRRPPRDAFNALLSFLYALLTSDCIAALSQAGLDPNHGFLHVLRSGRPALALDLMEEFRPLLADRTALSLVRQHQFHPSDVVEFGGGYRLNDAARRLAITAYQERKRENIKHPSFKSAIPWSDVPLAQARILARVVRGEVASYHPFFPE